MQAPGGAPVIAAAGAGKPERPASAAAAAVPQIDADALVKQKPDASNWSAAEVAAWYVGTNADQRIW